MKQATAYALSSNAAASWVMLDSRDAGMEDRPMEPPESDSATSVAEGPEAGEIVTRGWGKAVAAAGAADTKDAPSTNGEITPSPGGDPPSLTVRLLHASLEHAVYPVLVGHVGGSPLSGAEERLDDCLDHRLSRAQVARDYPEALGEFRHFPGLEDGIPPPGTIVVGLGPMGELTESQLSSVVTRSLTRFASEPRDRAWASVVGRASPQAAFDGRLGLASVLIGSSRSGGLTVESSIRAIIAGTVAANLRLEQIPLTVRIDGSDGGTEHLVRFSELWFVERHEDIVELAARSLERLANESHASGTRSVSYVPQPVSGEGAAGPNPPDDSANDVWARISIVHASGPAEGVAGLTYSLLGRASRAEQLSHEVDRELVDSLVAQSINRSSDPRIGSTLYELLVPYSLKQPLGSGSHLHLLLDEGTADYPWELLTPRAEAFRDSRPFALGGGLLRQFLEARDVRRGSVRAPEREVLVIGNPPPGPGFLPLPGARSEATMVARAFGGTLSVDETFEDLELPEVDPPWEVTARIWDEEGTYIGTPPTQEQATADPAEEIVHELMTGSWRVVHIAAHGVIDEGGNPVRSGVVLGPGRRLTASTIGQLSVVPDLVVVNACHLGAITRQLDGMNRVAASFARRLMQLGVRAVVVAGWAVEDAPAVRFAHALYSELLQGWELGDAVRHARAAAHRYDPKSLTWGAYQCYGDPGFRLAERRGRGGAVRKKSLTVSELRRRIRATAGMVSDRTSSLRSLQQGIQAVAELASEAPESTPDLVKELEDLERDPLYAEGSGSVRADIAADLAAAWAQLGRFDRAVDRYEEAVRAGGRDVPLAAVEQLINLSVRRAREVDDPDQRRKLLRSARQKLTALQTLGLTGERLALKGSFHKKRACLSDPPNRDDVRTALRCYLQAIEADKANNEGSDPYHELNARQLTAIVRQWDEGVPDAPRGDEHRFRRLLAEPPADFWSRNSIGDWMLTRLVEQELGAEPAGVTVSDMVDAYETAFRLRSSAFNRRSVIEHLVDLGTLLDADRPLKAELLDQAQAMRQRWVPPDV
jgi:tetratricopeptide (TPR) repeat protein